ncbi:MAG: hypothetical protein LUG99_11775 [Lachnospiraceae bacterium]|nr:hypothetical protein [Lachnospiraceae bacterium]
MNDQNQEYNEEMENEVPKGNVSENEVSEDNIFEDAELDEEKTERPAFNFEEYEAQCEKIRQENEVLLEEFAKSMSGLSRKTVNQHISNVNFYLNDYLLYEDAQSFREGVYSLDDYLGYFFIKKCMWSTPGTIKSTAASIKKFYKLMLDQKRIEKTDYEFLCEDINDNMEQWQEDCAQYNDPSAESPFWYF